MVLVCKSNRTTKKNQKHLNENCFQKQKNPDIKQSIRFAVLCAALTYYCIIEWQRNSRQKIAQQNWINFFRSVQRIWFYWKPFGVSVMEKTEHEMTIYINPSFVLLKPALDFYILFENIEAHQITNIEFVRIWNRRKINYILSIFFWKYTHIGIQHRFPSEFRENCFGETWAIKAWFLRELLKETCNPFSTLVQINDNY